jgi:hypothetical protein
MRITGHVKAAPLHATGFRAVSEYKLRGASAGRVIEIQQALLWPLALELKRDPLSHNADGVDRINDRVYALVQQIARRKLDRHRLCFRQKYQPGTTLTVGFQPVPFSESRTRTSPCAVLTPISEIAAIGSC